MKIFLVLSCIVALNLFSCREKTTIKNYQITKKIFDYTIDTSDIPNDTIRVDGEGVSLKNGIYYLNNKKFSGIIVKELIRVSITTYSSVYEGLLHGTYRSFYEDGKPYEVRRYKNNLATGRHYYYWKKTGNLKSDYMYYEDRKEGKQKRWYENGKPFMVLNFKDDKLDGLQQAWRENGKLYINYEAIKGRNYGLQRSQLCYNLANGNIE